MKTRDTKAILARMEANYSKQCSGLRGVKLVNFHRENLFIFIRRLLDGMRLVNAPFSDWFSHDLFLSVQAITSVVQRDFSHAQLSELDETTMAWFKEYFEQFELLRYSSSDISEVLERCLAILK